MAFRTDIADFPFQVRDKSVWYFVVDWKNKSQKDYNGVQDKKELIIFISEVISSRKTNSFQLFGVWYGSYSTDIFLLPIKESTQKLREYFQ